MSRNRAADRFGRSGRDELVNNGEDGDKESLEARKRLVLLNKQVAVLGESLKKAEMDPSMAELYVRPPRWPTRPRAHLCTYAPARSPGACRSEKEIIRRQDMLTKLRNQKEKLEAWIRQPKASTREQRYECA